jgi:hypothetical protein
MMRGGYLMCEHLCGSAPRSRRCTSGIGLEALRDSCRTPRGSLWPPTQGDRRRAYPSTGHRRTDAICSQPCSQRPLGGPRRPSRNARNR